MKKIIVSFLSVAMVICMMPSMAFAGSETSCEGGKSCMHQAAIVNADKTETHYDTLGEAVGAASESTPTTVKLLKDTTAVVTIGAAKNIILDLNGKTWTSETQSVLYGTLTVEDTSPDGTGVITNANISGTTEKATIKVEWNETGAEAATLTLKRGTIKTVKENRAAVYVNGKSGKTSGKFIMEGGTLISANGKSTYRNSALSGNSYSNLTINGGTIINETAVNDEAYYAVYGSGNASLTITGGDFNGYVKAVSTTKISGGNFTIEPYNINKYLTEGHILINNDGNGFSVVEGELNETNAGASLSIGERTTYHVTAKAALEKLQASEPHTGVIKLLRNESSSLVFKSDTNATFDLNGKTLLGHVDVEAGAELTVKDSTATVAPVLSDDYNSVTYESGKIYSTTPYGIKAAGTVTIESGMIRNAGGGSPQGFGNSAAIVAYNGGKVNINGGYIEAQEFGAKAFGNGSKIVLSGGIVYSKDNAALGGYGADTGETSIQVTGGIAVAHIESDGFIACGIYNPQPGKVEITGGQIIAVNGVGVLVRDGNLEVLDGEIKATGTAAGKVGDANVEIPSSGIVLDNTGKTPGESAAQVTVKGGSIIAEPSQKAITSEGLSGESQIQVSGGSFTSKVDSAYCAANYASIAKGDGTYTVQTHVHAVEKTAAKAATCGVAGNHEYWYCEGCDTCFKDEQLTVEITYEAAIIPATGQHNYHNGYCTVCQKVDPNYQPPGGGYIPPVDKAVELVEDLIKAIGDVTLDDEAAIEAARAAYDKLTEAQQKKVDNYKVLTEAEAEFELLKSKADEIAEIEGTKLAARSKNVVLANGKRAIRIQWYEVKDGVFTKVDKDAFDKVIVYRASKKNGEYKQIFTSRTDKYYNTAIKKGKRYFYKVRGVKEVDGQKIYTGYSLYANRVAR